MASLFKTVNAEEVKVPPVSALTSGLMDDQYVFITGQLAFDPAQGGVALGSDAKSQTKIIMDRIIAASDILGINEVYTLYVSEPFPARSTIGVAFLALPNARVEIEALARRR
ncbi:MAG: RidA family protein [Bernardetiaceae bacterium]|nr:RidA family protein [Bernardetiaceae bacterium]